MELFSKILVADVLRRERRLSFACSSVLLVRVPSVAR